MRAAAIWLGGMLVACGRPSDQSAGQPSSEALASRTAAQQQIDSLQVAGDSLFRRAADSAQTVWDSALVLARQSDDSVRIARALTGIAQSARVLGDFPRARQIGEQALALKRRLGMTAELFRSLNMLGLLARDEERLADADALLQEAAAAASATGDSSALAKVMLNRALVLQDFAQFAPARALFVGASERFAALGDSVNLGRAYNNLGALDIALGMPQSAVLNLERSRALMRSVGDSVGEVNALGQFATAFTALGEPARAFAALDSALQLATRRGLRVEVADNLRLMGDQFLEAGDPQLALDHYRRSAALNDTLKQPEQHATLLRSQARALWAAGNPSMAYTRATAALAEHVRGDFRFPALLDRLLLAELAQDLGRTAEADEHVRLAKTTAAAFDAPIAESQVALVAARIAAARGAWREVLRVLDTPNTTLFAASDAIAERLSLQSRAHAQLGDLPQAVADGRAAMAAIDQMRQRYQPGELRQRYADSKSRIYADLALTLLRMGNVREAFTVADAARGRAILEHLSESRAAVARDAGTARLAEADALLRRIDALVRALEASEQLPPRERSGASVVTTRALRDSLRVARAEYEALRARVDAQGTTASRSSLIQTPPTTLADVQRRLLPHELLLEYFVAPDRLVIFAVTTTETRQVEQIVTSSALASRVGLARALIAQRQPNTVVQPVLQALYRDLVAPVAGEVFAPAIRTVVVVPHGLLSYLPFSALVHPTSGRFLIEDRAVMVAPSAAVFATLRAATAAVPAGSPKIFALAPYADDLPGTKAEVRTMQAAPLGALSLFNAEATEGRLRAVLAEDAMVHVATHARLNPYNPLFSRIELRAGKDGDASDNGWLEVHEILGLRVRSPLVFLSGCETAVGSTRRTQFEERDDFTSIAHAWLVSGARTVVATLWRIDDQAAATVATRFYEALQRSSAPEAMATAQRAMLRDPNTRRPYYWAAYQVAGDGRFMLPGTTADNFLLGRANSTTVSVRR